MRRTPEERMNLHKTTAASRNDMNQEQANTVQVKVQRMCWYTLGVTGEACRRAVYDIFGNRI